jgi:hypothetical protein
MCSNKSCHVSAAGAPLFRTVTADSDNRFSFLSSSNTHRRCSQTLLLISSHFAQPSHRRAGASLIVGAA